MCDVEYFHVWVEKIILINEELIMCRENSVSETLERIRDKNQPFIPVFSGDDTLGIHYMSSILSSSSSQISSSQISVNSSSQISVNSFPS